MTDALMAIVLLWLVVSITGLLLGKHIPRPQPTAVLPVGFSQAFHPCHRCAAIRAHTMHSTTCRTCQTCGHTTGDTQ